MCRSVRAHGETKTERSRRTLALPAAAVQALRAWSRSQAGEQFAAGQGWQDTGLVFTNQLGGPIEPRNMNRMFYRLCEKAGVPKVRVHDLRHSCATLLFAQGVEAATVQAILRHSSIAVTTGIYMEVIERVKRDALDSMDLLFPGADDTATA